MNVPRLFIIIAGIAMGYAMRDSDRKLFWICYAVYLVVAAFIWILSPQIF